MGSVQKEMISPGVAVGGLLGYSIMIAFRQSFNLVDVLPVLVAVWAMSSELKIVLKRIAVLNLFIFFISGTMILLHDDTDLALLILIRSNLILSVSVLLFSGKPGIYIYFGFKSLKVPEKFSVLLFFTVKYIEILMREYDTIKNALALRGFKMKTDLFTYRTIAHMFGMLFFRSIRRAGIARDAMALRGFKGELFHLNRYPLVTKDYVLIVAISFQILGVWIN
jgi:cobalt/nickel transport system permease protein